VVFFQERSAQLDGQAQNVVSRAAARAKNNPTSSVKVVGYTVSGARRPFFRS
jgi:outer membrane protein OmpA-like peptidoglycan-associated protein